jgi:hypothetical protein
VIRLCFDTDEEKTFIFKAVSLKLRCFMISMYEKRAYDDVVARINKLSPASQRQWGKMNVAQMMAHCSTTLECATGKVKLPRLLIGRILGPLVKSSYLSEKPFSKNSPTDKSFIIADERDFDAEKQKLLQLIKEFSEGGEEKCTTHPHSFFGKLTPAQWGTSMYKHLDHHLRQFGV